MSEDLAQDFRFRKTRIRARLAADEVELFVTAVEDALRSPSAQRDVCDVAWRRFTPVMPKPGYAVDTERQRRERGGRP